MLRTRLRRTDLPMFYDADGKRHVNRRASRLIRKCGGRVLTYRRLPKEAQLALLHYMSIDGEAWDQPQALADWLFRVWEKTSERGYAATLRKHLPAYVNNYGDVRFGYIRAVPILALIESALKDPERANHCTWEKHHASYMAHATKHAAVSEKPWPVILSSFDDQTLEDGWSRFHQYADRGLATCPALWFPGNPVLI